MALKLSQLYQPRNPDFWLLVILNLLSTAISYLLRQQELPLPLTLLLVAFALGNVIYGLRIAVRLMATEPGERKDK